MINTIRKSKATKVIACYLAIQLLLQMTQPTQLWALTSGPSQPEFNSFTPIGTSDMVNLSSGNFNYNIPVMDVGGYPLNLAYDSGVTMDQEASWVGLGWNLNVGQISRQVRGIPDDFKGDEMIYEDNMRDNVTVGVHAGLDPQIFGIETPDGVNVTVGVDLKYNNYSGLSFKPSYGLSFGLSENVSVGMQVETSATEGATISPNISGKFQSDRTKDGAVSGSLNAGISYNSNRGLSYNINAGVSYSSNDSWANYAMAATGVGSGSGSFSSFENITFTPRKRTAFTDINGTVALSLGADVWGLDGELEVSAMGAVQKIKNPIKTEKAYGYEYTGFASTNDVLDYNREKDGLISKSTLVLPTASYTYDLYTVQGQGAGGMFRPFRSQVGQINDQFVQDESASFSLGLEIEPGSGFHVGVNLTDAPSESHTGIWDTKALQHFKQEREDVDDKLDYESVYLKYIGEPRVDQDQKLFEDLGGYAPVALEIGGSKKSFDKQAENRFRIKEYNGNDIPEYRSLPAFDTKFKRESRDVRNQNIQKISSKELTSFYNKDYAETRINNNAKPHHTAEVRVQNADGSTYVFGEAAYNNLKKEVTFTTDSDTYNCAAGTVRYGGNENTRGNKAGIDHFFNAVHTPAYAHTYLLSTVLSSDYEDLTGNGPTDDDLGAYTNFVYTNKEDSYKWRIPYSKTTREASYNAGLNTNRSDQKGSYIYGEKEIKYIDKIVTKTHVAIFDLSPRKDARGANGENGGVPSSGSQQMYKIDKIRLYSKPEALKANILDDDASNDLPISTIKTAHFIYDYSQCKNVENNHGGTPSENELSNDKGKLTLKKVYFTYRDSKMGKYTPYEFHYDGFNPDYNLKSYDVWGNYKPNIDGGCNTQDPITAPEFPFVQQGDRVLQDQYASAWSLTSIDLPSGGKIDMTYESDDYQYVQDRDAMQMFKVVGAGEKPSPGDPEGNQKLYKSGVLNVFDGDADYLYVKLPNETDVSLDFNSKYLRGIEKKPIYFRFLMNMTKAGALSTSSKDYDYVTGYFEVSENKSVNVFKADNESIYAAIPMKMTDIEGGVLGNKPVNPISKAGWYFGRQYMNGLVYGINSDYRTENIQTIAKKVISSFAAIKDIFTGPNAKLRSNQYLCAQRFIPQKSWIRLSTPKKYKLGGGVRVKKLVMKDQWNKMVDPAIADDDKKYSKEYGQTYDYTLSDGGSSGVATYEPNQSKENPFVEPFYNKGERLIAPREVSYVEKPFGEAFFPGATVTYSKVTVSNLEREDITKHATGKVVSEFFTSKDYPTKVDYTDIDSPDNYATNQNEFLQNLIKGLFGQPVETKNEYALSQGFMVHTNDMNGKMRFQKVYAENQDKPLSSVEYRYSTSVEDVTRLDNTLPVVNKDGVVEKKQIGVDYDVVTDFRESYSKSQTKGYKGNLVVLFIGPFPVPVPLIVPSSTKIENVAHSAITTKVIHTTAVMKEKIATDLGSRVSTINEAWDAETGQVLLTRTVNEFDDEYFNFSFPAYWTYDKMGQASKNIGITGVLKSETGGYYNLSGGNTSDYFVLGDEIIGTYGDETERLWVVGFNDAGTALLLMNRFGQVVNRSASDADNALEVDGDIQFKIVRSGYRNQQMANMASITMMKNPIRNAQGDLVPLGTNNFMQSAGTPNAQSLRIVNASAVGYTDFWNCQCERGLPSLPFVTPTSSDLADLAIEDYKFNPYLFNAHGEWRAEKSYAYLTERSAVTQGGNGKVNNRKEGYFKEFTPYYTFEEGKWDANEVNTNKWTSASEVTQYSPYGAEVENKDALNRYSSAQYGYNMTLPTAVASNSRYRYMGADNFEDYEYSSSVDLRYFDYLNEEEVPEEHFNFKKAANDDGSDTGVMVSDEFSHTGMTSLLIPKNDDAVLRRPLKGELPQDLDYDDDGRADVSDNCPYTKNYNQRDYDGDGIGDVCDDDAVPTITSIVTKPQETYRIKRSFFTIEGKPNDVVRYKTYVSKTLRRGQELFVNGVMVADKEIGSVQLDVTGKARMEFVVKANRPKKRKQRGRTLGHFVLLNKNSNIPVSGVEIRLCPDAGKKKDSHNGDTGYGPWNCDTIEN